MSKSELAVRGPDGAAFTAPLWLPEKTPAPGIVILPPIFGIDQQMRDLAALCAKRGNVALVLNQFWRDAQPDTFARTPEDRPLAMARGQRADPEVLAGDVGAAIAALRARPECDGTISVMGYCFGGRYVMLAAARDGIDAGATFHGTQMVATLGEASRMAAPLSLHFGADDALSPPEDIAAIRAAFAGRDDVEIVAYPGAGHNFSQPGWPGYVPDVAERSQAAAFALFDRVAAARSDALG